MIEPARRATQRVPAGGTDHRRHRRAVPLFRRRDKSYLERRQDFVLVRRTLGKISLESHCRAAALGKISLESHC